MSAWVRRVSFCSGQQLLQRFLTSQSTDCKPLHCQEREKNVSCQPPWRVLGSANSGEEEGAHEFPSLSKDLFLINCY